MRPLHSDDEIGVPEKLSSHRPAAVDGEVDATGGEDVDAVEMGPVPGLEQPRGVDVGPDPDFGQTVPE